MAAIPIFSRYIRVAHPKQIGLIEPWQSRIPNPHNASLAVKRHNLASDYLENTTAPLDLVVKIDLG